MEADIQRLLDTFGDLRKEANVNACFAEPVTVEGRTIIPVAKIGYALGLGAGQGPRMETEEVIEEMKMPSAAGSGGGAGVISSPLGVVEVTSQGTRVEPIIDRQRVAIVSMVVGAWGLFWLARALMAIFSRRD